MRALLIIFVAACGLAPEPAGTPGPSEGIGPWTDLGQVRVCRGEQAFAPPASSPGGLCVRATFEAASCERDDQCASREACVCGRCTVPFCAVASDCEAPRFCNFAQHRCDLPCDACADGELCLGGVCRVRCLDSTDCQFGEVCDGNTCIGDDCSADGDCLAGERCDLQRVPQQVLEPSPLVTGNRTVLYLDLADPATPDVRAIWRASSTDGVHFAIEPAEPVLDGRAPSAVLAADGSTHVYFEDPAGQGLLAATSIDGLVFGRPRVVLVGNELRSPTALHLGDVAVLYFANGSSIDARGAIGLATGPVGDALTPDGLVLAPTDVEVGDGTPGTAFWTPITTLASPHAMLSGGSIHLYFSAFGTESPPGTQFGMEHPIPPNFSIGFAATDPADPAHLAAWPYGPIADRVDVFLTHLDEFGPGVIEPETGVFRMYFVDGDGTALGRLLLLGSGGSATGRN